MLAAFTDDWSTGAVLLAGVFGVCSWPATVLVHELGHAFVARWHGVPVEELVSTPEGRNIRVTIAGVPMRVGLGLKREWRSKELFGWVKLGEAQVSKRAATQIVAAGPIAHGAFSALALLVALLAHPPEPLTLPLVMHGAIGILTALACFAVDKEGESDGAVLQRIRRLPERDPQR